MLAFILHCLLPHWPPHNSSLVANLDLSRLQTYPDDSATPCTYMYFLYTLIVFVHTMVTYTFQSCVLYIHYSAKYYKSLFCNNGRVASAPMMINETIFCYKIEAMGSQFNKVRLFLFLFQDEFTTCMMYTGFRQITCTCDYIHIHVYTRL